ncbi:hypothetical protein CCICO_11325 [Corynebacterium ciconiae DSM 44920]|uniref:hypothetical protein n=1 Tax=Corynebacterium ciconiae TaxID=227319 RepID=UPI00036AE47C|nr:hypothetical protein [Corynebacterium ciconiae]WKD62256.1 hypothetical protein CCICO_11325 [Corynebacterium ciconiae DSM 44920]
MPSEPEEQPRSASEDSADTPSAYASQPEGHYFDPTVDRVTAPRRGVSREEFERDPLLWFEHSRRSSRWAVCYLLAVPTLTILTGLLIALLSRSQGGPICEAGLSTWICSRGYEIAFSLIPLGVALTGTFGAFWITYRIWARYGAWRPWLAIIWVLIPASLAWMTGFGWMFVNGHH